MDNSDAVIDRARAAAEAARDAAAQAEAYADQLAATAHAATGGAVVHQNFQPKAA